MGKSPFQGGWREISSKGAGGKFPSKISLQRSEGNFPPRGLERTFPLTFAVKFAYAGGWKEIPPTCVCKEISLQGLEGNFPSRVEGKFPLLQGNFPADFLDSDGSGMRLVFYESLVQ